ncbi:porin family protein [Aliivibrio kagoshimensis]|uniref:porin family protein n=1 Tax=Aliivibrio kagoshimensis TaxID=2910230 RepID=UPI003D13DE2A
MKKNILPLVISIFSISSPFSFALADDDYQGHRIGAGFSTTAVYLDTLFTNDWYDYGSGFKVEYGYDINRIFGINLSYETNKDAVSISNLSSSMDGTTFKINSDIGYAFLLNGWAIKPYGSVGLVSYKEEGRVSCGSNCSINSKYSDNTLSLGAGVRAHLDSGLYADFRNDFFVTDNEDIAQLSLTLGYRF